MISSFSAAVKEESAGMSPHTRTGKLAMLSALVHTAGTLLVKNEGLELKILSEQESVLGAFERTAIQLYGERSFFEVKRNEHEFVLSGEFAKRLLFDCAILKLDGEKLKIVAGIEPRLVESADGRTGYLKGAFLGSGSISLKSGYHLEITLSNAALARDIASLFSSCEFAAKNAERKDKFIVYIKDSEAISDCLALFGASKGVLRLNEMMVARQVNRAANRSKNCDLANLDRTVNVAFMQGQIIKDMQKSGAVSLLEPRLKETAQARLDNPDATYAELALVLGISKSGVKHRLAKLVEIFSAKE